MKPQGIFQVLFCILALLAVAVSAGAEWIILTSGEKFQTERSWKENGRLKFRLNGLVVSVPQSDVARVIESPTAAADPAVEQKAAQRSPADPLRTATATGALLSRRKERLQSALRLPPPKPKSALKAQLAKPPEKASARPSTPDKPPQAPALDPPAAAAPTPHPSRGVFRNLAWGMRPSSMPGLLLSQTNPAYGGVDEFFYPEEDLNLGEAPLNAIVYGFWQNRLYTITIWTDGRPSYEKLRRWVIDTYGPGHQRKKAVERRVWYGDGSDRLLEFDETLNSGIFWMRSEKLHARIERVLAQ
jgi:hypothetical protein